MEERAEKSFTLILLPEKLLRKTTFLCCKIEYFLVIEITTKSLCLYFAYYMSTASYLASYIHDNFLSIHTL